MLGHHGSISFAGSFALMYFSLQVQLFRFVVEGLSLSPFFMLYVVV
jgi:hypothetical protein